MQPGTLAAAAGIALLSGCAQTGMQGASPEANATASCRYFAREQGMEWVQTRKTAASSDGFAVTMQLKDALGRAFDATCLHAAGKNRWAVPLPANAVGSYQSRDTMKPPR